MNDPIRFQVRTRAGLRGTTAGGSWVENSARNTAVLVMLARALDTDRDQLQIVSGENDRTKLIEWTDPPPDAVERIANWHEHE